MQVEDLLNVLCEETDIAEVELKMGGFKMKVRRSLKGGAAAAAGAVDIAGIVLLEGTLSLLPRESRDVIPHFLAPVSSGGLAKPDFVTKGSPSAGCPFN